MNNELECIATLKSGRTLDIVVSYEVDGVKPLIYGLFDTDDNDITNDFDEAEYDRIYGLICEHIVSSMTDGADYLQER